MVNTTGLVLCWIMIYCFNPPTTIYFSVSSSRSTYKDFITAFSGKSMEFAFTKLLRIRTYQLSSKAIKMWKYILCLPEFLLFLLYLFAYILISIKYHTPSAFTILVIFIFKSLFKNVSNLVISVPGSIDYVISWQCIFQIYFFVFLENYWILDIMSRTLKTELNGI